ncbi:hypothetical protein VTH82DRAFT_1301 [Thermothelomyces myriococcoides]
MGQGKKPVQDLDSAELEAQFLSAIGFTSSSETRMPDSRLKLLPLSQPCSHVRNELGNLGEERGQLCDLPTDRPGTPTRKPRRSRQTHQEEQPKGLTNAYWVAQRIAKGIVDPSAYLYYEDRSIESSPSCHYDLHQASPLTNSHPGFGVSKHKKLENVPSKGGSVLREEFGSSGMSCRRGRGQMDDGQRSADPGDHERHGGLSNGGHGSVPSPRLDQLEPDLSKYPVPRPNKNHQGSSYSLPSLGSGFTITSDGPGARQSKGTDVDIRNTIGLKPSIYKSPGLGNTWTKYNWSDPNGRDADETFTQASYLEPFINAWMKCVPRNIVADFSNSGETHWKCDIDTFTGRLLPPVIQPETMLDTTPLDPNMEWRRRNWTSTLLRKHYNTRRNGHVHENKHRTSPTQLEFTAPESVPIDKPVIQRPKYHRFVPRVPCHLRPAVKDDMMEACVIYNWEPGLGGSAESSSRATARVNVFVHPRYKRKKIGFSLLDMLLRTVSDCFSSEAAYDFIDPDDSPLYKKGQNHPRQFYKLYLSYRVPHKFPAESNKDLDSKQGSHNDDLSWVKRLVEDRLNFTELVRYEAAHRSSYVREGPIYWLDEVVFEHTYVDTGGTFHI